MNNTVRFITGARRREKTEELMASVNWMSLEEMIRLHTLTFHMENPESECTTTPSRQHLLWTRQPDKHKSTKIEAHCKQSEVEDVPDLE